MVLRKFMLGAAISLALSSSAAPSDIERKMERAGLVDIAQCDTTIRIDLIYATPQNFVGRIMYDNLSRAYLLPKAMKALSRASELLRAEHPGLRLKVTDAARPMSVQQQMYDVVKGTSKAPYVSNPANGGGLHNYGMAVDLTLVDLAGREVDMGTIVDHLGPEANIDKEEQLIKRGVLTAEQVANRRILRRVMSRAGYKPLRSEWWHFNLCSRDEAKRTLRVLDF